MSFLARCNWLETIVCIDNDVVSNNIFLSVDYGAVLVELVVLVHISNCENLLNHGNYFRKLLKNE